MNLYVYKGLVVASMFLSPALISVVISYLAYNEVNYNGIPWIYASCFTSCFLLHLSLLFKKVILKINRK